MREQKAAGRSGQPQVAARTRERTAAWAAPVRALKKRASLKNILERVTAEAKLRTRSRRSNERGGEMSCRSPKCGAPDRPAIGSGSQTAR
mgnify:CR=1 FL=1